MFFNLFGFLDAPIDLIASDIIPASIVVMRFLLMTTDSLWDQYENNLVETKDDPEQFNHYFSQLSPVHKKCVSVLAEHISILASNNHTIEDWCSKLFFKLLFLHYYILI